MTSEKDWPRQIDVAKGTIIIYQPQLESFNENEIKARAAIAVTPKGEAQPSYGAVWIEASLVTDRDRRLASISNIRVPRVRFAGSTPQQENRLKAFLEEEMPKWEMTLSMDRLLLGMESTNRGLMTEERLLSNPPKIIASQVPTVLMTIVGDPKLKMIEGMRMMRVVNSPFQIFFDPESKRYFINGGEVWFSAQNLKGAWTIDETVPASLAQLYSSRTKGYESIDLEINEQPPRIIVSTEPAELIVFDGPPKFEALVDAELQYAINTDNDVFFENNSRQIYILLAGRWFRAASFSGPWESVPANRLPACFTQIPDESAKGRVLASIAGTPMANEAVMDNQIPQTAIIQRKEVILKVTYDGAPVFKPIDGFNMKYAENSPFSILAINKHYFCCHYAIWYESDDPQGPWRICDRVPDLIYSIPPTCPLYNVKFVRVYSSTPDRVHVGYTPGYIGSYVANGTVIYGTGHTYRDWFQNEYIARPLTWGLNARYNPMQGAWGLFADHISPGGKYRIIPGSLSGRSGRIRVWSMAGWWGSGGYRDYSDMSGSARKLNHARISAPAKRKQNIYDLYQSANVVVSGQRPGGISSTRNARVAAASERKNDLYIDKTGTVYRRTVKGWEKRETADWIEVRMADAATQSKMDEEYRTRQQGMEREQRYGEMSNNTE